jgi:hypothetical protein
MLAITGATNPTSTALASTSTPCDVGLEDAGAGEEHGGIRNVRNFRVEGSNSTRSSRVTGAVDARRCSAKRVLPAISAVRSPESHS